MYNYCTLFDSNYLTRGVAMYESLYKHSSDFHLYIFAFDDRAYDMLNKLELSNATIISLQEFEDDELLALKDSRSAGEYCWTCTPSIIKYSIDRYGLDSATYLDADLYFFDDPSILIDEMGEDSVLITEHRYSPQYQHYSDLSGIYCVQFMTFKSDESGMKVLNWWREACNEWCYARYEDGKFGDQKYLDDWTTRFRSIHVLQNIGGGVAPWNIEQYDISDSSFNLIFYHFHNYKFLQRDRVELSRYKFRRDDIELLYKPYTRHLESISDRLKTIDSRNDYNGIVKREPFHWKDPFRILKRKLNGNYNIYHKRELLGE